MLSTLRPGSQASPSLGAPLPATFSPEMYFIEEDEEGC